MPAAAGGPKGLALIPFDQRFADAWLPAIPHLDLIGASIGAWRVAALAQPDARDALERLRRAYVHDQDYAPDPSPAEVSARIRAIARAVLGPAGLCVRERVSLDVIVARSRGPLDGQRSRVAFGRAALANAWSRARLAAHFERVVLHAGAASTLPPPRDAFGRTEVGMNASNAEDALTATASIPLVCEPVARIAGAPRGEYWDGGMIDYHLMLPYDALDGIVLYPHFVPHVTPGWLDKHLPWRARPRRHRWLANVVVIAPVARVPRAPAQRQASRPRRLLPLRPGPRAPHPGLEPRDRRVRALRRRRDAMARATGPVARTAAVDGLQSAGTARRRPPAMPRLATILAALACAALAPLAAAQDYPSRPVRIVVPFAAGGPADVYARVLAQRLQESLGQPFVIENRPGGGSVLGTDIVAKSAPDGYTLLLMSNTHTVNESLMPQKPFVLMRDFVGVAPINYSTSCWSCIRR
jgi:predicted acylesterase/phospholipase RssA